MRGAYFLGDHDFEVREIIEKPLKEDEVLIKVAVCGVCGTDVHIYHGSKGSAEVSPPVILGHEFAGTVVRVGNAVKSLSLGDHISVDPNIFCGYCHFCRMGKKQLCSNLIAIGVNRDGGFAEYCYVPDRQCHKLNEELPLKTGAMVEPLACCIHGFDRLNMRQGDTVCVIGGGSIGLMMIQLAKISGASLIILSEPVEYRRQIGLSLGADYAIDPLNENLYDRIKEITMTDGVDIIIECVGNTLATEQSFEIAKKGASILLFSVPKWGSMYSLHMDDIFQKELTILGSIINPDTHARAVEMINRKKIIVEPLITHKFSIGQLKEAIQMQMGQDSIKVIVGE